MLVGADQHEARLIEIAHVRIRKVHHGQAVAIALGQQLVCLSDRDVEQLAGDLPADGFRD